MFIWTIRTILVFGKKVTWYRKTLPKKRKWGKVTFWDHSKNELIHQGYVLKSSPLSMKLPQGLLFLINRHFWKFQTCPFWKKCAFPYIWAFSRWRRRRRRRRADNFSIWPDPHPIACRDEISRSGIPHFDNIRISSQISWTSLNVEDNSYVFI